MNPAAVFWDIAPYVTIAVLVVGTWWRYRYDKFGWTTRSSQLYESRLLRIGSPLFHFGILVVIVGHVIGLLIPESWTTAPASYQIHAIIGMALFALWPFTRLVHAFSAPIGYLFRPYIVYRSRDAARPGEPIGSRPRRRGW